MKRTIVLGLIAFALATAAASTKLTARQAEDHIGEVKTVCGLVASTRCAERSKGQPTFLNLDERYPNEIFTILIWGEDRAKFGSPESKYRDANLCVTGKISIYRGTRRKDSTRNPVCVRAFAAYQGIEFPCLPPVNSLFRFGRESTLFVSKTALSFGF